MTPSATASSAPDRPATRVVFVVGAAHSGSTIIGRALGQLPGVLSIGEAHGFWFRARDRGSCACGAPLDRCPTWSSAIREARDPAGMLPAPEAASAWWQSTVRNREVPGMLARGGPRPSSPLASYAHALVALYRLLQDATGADVLVDTGKSPAEAALLMTSPDVELHLLHLVRDPRAVAWSWLRRAEGRTDVRPAHRPVASTRNWIGVNSLADVLARRGGGRRLRYEQWAAAPRAELDVLAHWIGMPAAGRDGDADTLTLRDTHEVAGNRSVARGDGPVRIRVDEAWQSALPRSTQWALGAFAAPWLAAYGYRVAPPRRRR